MDGHGYFDILHVLCAVLVLFSSLLSPLFKQPHFAVIAATSSTLLLGLLLGLILGLHVFEAVTAFVEAARHSGLPDALPVSSPVIFALAYVVQLESLCYEGPETLSHVHLSAWIIGFWLESTRAIILLASKHHSFQPFSVSSLVTAIKCLSFTALFLHSSRVREWSGNTESLPEGEGNNDSAPVTSTNTANNHEDSKFDQDAHEEMAELGGWWPWVKRFSVFWKYIWPVGQPKMQIIAISSVLLAFVTQILVALSSYYLGRLVTKLSETTEMPELRRDEVLPSLLKFAITRALTTDGGIPTLRTGLFVIIRMHRDVQFKCAIHEKTMRLSFAFHNTVNSAGIIRIPSDSQGLLNVLDDVVFVLVPQMIMLMISVTFLITKHGPLMALILLWLVVCYFIVQRRSAKKLPIELERYTTLRRDMEADCHENIRHWETIASQGKTTAAIERHHLKVATWAKQWFRWLKSHYVGQFSTGVVLIFIFFFGLLLILNDFFNKKATAGDFAAFASYWTDIIASLNLLKTKNIDAMKTLFEATRGRRLLEIPIQVKGGKKFELRGGAIRFKNVTYYYQRMEDAVLKHFNLHIEAGKKVVFIGKSGIGKSTLIKLLLGLLDPKSGHIEVDDQNIEDIDTESFLSRVVFIGQQTSLRGGSIMSNMLDVNSNAAEEQVHEACKKACIHDVINSLPNKYNTHVGDGGHAFSDGQRQRLNIARMLLQNPDIVVLDEATSALDVETKASVQEAINKEFPGKTIMSIDHDLITTKSADIIIVLGEGCSILEQGNHESLLKEGGHYAKLWEMHIGGDSDK